MSDSTLIPPGKLTRLYAIKRAVSKHSRYCKKKQCELCSALVDYERWKRTNDFDPLPSLNADVP